MEVILYCNLVIEEVSGKSFADYMQKNIFKPLKMKHTSFNISKKILKNSAKHMMKKQRKFHYAFSMRKQQLVCIQHIDDLILFAKASFSKNPVLSEESIALLIEPTELSKGNYGMGYMV